MCYIYEHYEQRDQEAKYIWGATDRRFTISNALYSLVSLPPSSGKYVNSEMEDPIPTDMHLCD